MNGKPAVALLVTSVSAIALLSGIGVGQAMTSSPAHDAAVNAPQPTATTTVSTVRDEVPAVCLTALDEADQGFTYASSALGATTAWMRGELDISDAADKVGTAGRNLTALAPKYNADKQACRTAAGQG